VNAYYGVSNAYSEVVYENSPLARVEQQASPGADWEKNGGHTRKMEYLSNNTGEVKRIQAVTSWNAVAMINDVSLIFAPDDAYTSGGYYNASTLYKTVAKDEDGKEAYSFVDSSGRNIMIRKINKKNNGTVENLDTYYVYDEFGNLSFVIPPKAALFNTAAELNGNLNTLCYQYKYDQYQRLAEKKLPGKDWEYFVYDKQNRQVLGQDGNLRTAVNTFGQRGWMFTKYDALGRSVYSGFFANTGTRAAMQTALNSMSANALNNEKASTTAFSQNSMDIYYTKEAFPTGSVTVLSVNYYDEYPAGSPAAPAQIKNQAILAASPTTIVSNGFSSIRSLKNSPTVSYVRNVENNGWTSAVIWYDTNGRPVGTYGQNHLGGFTKTETLLDFAGRTLEVDTQHSRNSGTAEVAVTDRFVYNPQQFLSKHYQKINTNAEELLADYTYDELGKLINKKVGNNLQNIDYTYNIRGWLTGINPNDIETLNTKLFAYKIKYNTVEGAEVPNNSYTDLKVKPKYNGGIAEVDWKTAYGANEPLRRYGYVYDGAERLQAGFFQPGSNPYTKEYTEVVDYDLNGNISSLLRTGGIVKANAEVADDLKYYYTNGGNQLDYIEEMGQGNALSGYPLPQGIGKQITYDPNGNMISHLDKGITKIAFNFLNLPSAITGASPAASLNYIYSADGTKVQMSRDTEISDYLGNFQYTSSGGNIISSVLANEEGYYDFKNSRYVYQYKDHLGNIRLSYARNTDGSPQILEENSYYPFGLKHAGYNTGDTTNNKFKYLYNGKELQANGNLDYGWRQYMPDLGRWNGMDQLAESYHSFSPYAYVMNNPLSLIDPDGRLTQKFLTSIWNSSSNNEPTYWYNIGGSLESNSGVKIGYEGNYMSLNTAMDAEGGGNEPGIIHIPTIRLTGKHNEWGQAFQDAFNSFVEKLNSEWYSLGGKTNWYLGSAAIAIAFKGGVNSKNMYSQGIRRGVSGNYQLTGRNLSLFGKAPMTEVTQPISKVAKFGKGLGTASFYFGLASDGIGVRNYLQNPNSKNAVHPAKFGLNTIMGIAGNWGGPIGASIGTIYFGVDNNYDGPGGQGWPGFFNDANTDQKMLDEGFNQAGPYRFHIMGAHEPK
ncbi:RHS repeat domain-containing protein, partial [Chryseobacterium sp. SIMBA_029]|uniref:RHS repeat domain-containing protein n=3 Tax=Bacteria TaxID=2 RepID=UPI00397A92E7